MKKVLLRASTLVLSCTLSIATLAQMKPDSSVNVPAGDLASSLEVLRKQTGLEIIYSASELSGAKSKKLQGKYSSEEALKRLLDGSDFTLKVDASGAYAIVKKSTAPVKRAPKPQARSENESNAGSGRGDDVVSLPEILVQGSRSLNADVYRSEDDIRPYVVFTREEIDNSDATSIEEFLNTRLPMNASRGTASRNTSGTSRGNRSSFDLRGLGENQTLILINGRRAPGVQTGRGTDLAQPDVNGIPLAAIDSIEILPATASGIYGGGATGGVINIILRKDYQGTDIQVRYDNSFDTDSNRRRIDASTGFTLEDGKTQVMISAGYSDGNDLLAGDRDFVNRARQAALANDPDSMENSLPLSNRANFRSIDGADLTLLDGTSLGTTFGSVPAGYLGGDAGQGLLGGAGTYDLSLPVGITGARQSLSVVPTTKALSLTLRRKMSSKIDAYLDVGTTRNDGRITYAAGTGQFLLYPGDAGNPFQNLITMSLAGGTYEAATLTTAETSRVNGGLIAVLPADWSAGLDFNWNRSTERYVQNYASYDTFSIESAIASGALNAFRDTALRPLDLSAYLNPTATRFGPAELTSAEYSLRVGGPLFSTAAGPAHLTGLASIRNDIAEAIIEPSSSGGYRYYPERHQEVRSLYAELALPLISPLQEIPFVNELDAQASLRFDEYETVSYPVGATTLLPSRDAPRPQLSSTTQKFDALDYTLGFGYRPIQDIKLRASYATGYLPPSISQIASVYSAQGYSFVRDPRRGGTRSFYVAENVFGGNPNLEPETSKSISAGFIYTPSILPGLRLSLDYTQIDKKDEITTLTQQQIVDNEDAFPGRVVRGAGLPTDPAGYAGRITFIDTSLVNVASSRVEAYDFQIDYELSIGNDSDLRLYSIATLQTELERQILPTSSVVDRVGYNDGPLRWRGNIGFVWKSGRLSVAGNTQLYPGYKSYSSSIADQYPQLVEGFERLQGGDIDSQAYTDLSMRYAFKPEVLGGVELSLAIRNIFNELPPTIAGWESTGGYSTFGDPRLRTYAISIKKSF